MDNKRYAINVSFKKKETYLYNYIMSKSSSSAFLKDLAKSAYDKEHKENT